MEAAAVKKILILLGCLALMVGCERTTSFPPYGSQVNLKQLAKEHPNNSLYPYLLGELAFKEGNIESARKYYVQALEINPSSIKAKIGLAYVFLQQKNFDAAKKLFNQVLKQDPLNRDANSGLHRLYFEKFQQKFPPSS